MNMKRRWGAGLLILALVCAVPGFAADENANAPAAAGSAPAASDQPQPKFIWGILLTSVGQAAFEVFKNWLATKLTGGTPSGDCKDAAPSNASEGSTRSQIASAVVNQVVANMNGGTQNDGAQSDASQGDGKKAASSADCSQSSANASSTPETLGGSIRDLKIRVATAAIVEVANYMFNNNRKNDNVVVGTPATTLVVNDGAANFQAVHVSIVDVDRQGTPVGVRPVVDGFHTGDRIKLRVVSTFDAQLAIDNINPEGVEKRIYPGKPTQVVALKAGEETLIPLGRDQFFQFAGVKGREQLVLTIRDPRANGDTASDKQVYRRDERYGSNFVQEVAPNRYAAIYQSIELSHQ